MEETSNDAPSPGGAWKISLAACFILLLELALIRQIPAEVRAISYFTNLILMGSFFGLGVGCILQEWRRVTWLLPLGLALLAAFIFAFRGIVIFDEAPSVQFFLQYTNLPPAARRFPLFPAAVIAFIATGIAFTALGQVLARTMSLRRPLTAYSWDIAGSLAGTIGFTILAVTGTPPWLVIPIATAIWAWIFIPSRWERAVHIAAGALFFVFFTSAMPSSWSPYYFVQHRILPQGLQVFVNSSFHQFAINFESNEPAVKRFSEASKDAFNLPYRVYREHHEDRGPDSVLILGAGTGNDVNIALQNGARRVVAVEIDPAIVDLGRRFNPSRPYDDPRVEVVVDDARHYVSNARDRFDLVVIGTLDSQTLFSGHANLRLENYVYTLESIQNIRDILGDAGMFAAYYSVAHEWLTERLYTTVHEVFAERTRIYRVHQEPFLFNTVLMGAPGIESFLENEADTLLYGGGIPSTDDWPYMYLQRRTIAPIYLKLSAVMLVLLAGVFVLLRRLHQPTGAHLNFLFLGLGFTLMETAAIVRLALLFGNTWIVNSVVISGVLLTIFLANLLVLGRRAPGMGVAWAGLGLFILINYMFPLRWALALDFPLRAALSIALIGAPVFFAAVCFSRLFAREKIIGYALGINLIGAMAGGLLEYLSMVIGMRDVWLVALLIYLFAFLATHGVSIGSKRSPPVPSA